MKAGVWQNRKPFVFRKAWAVLLLSALWAGGCNFSPDLTISYEFQSSPESVAHLKNAYARKDAISYRSYMFYVHALRVLRPNWPPAENALLFPPGSVTDDEGAYDPGTGKPGCWTNESGMGVTYDFFCGKTIDSPPQPPVGSYRVQVGADSSWSIPLAESRLVQGIEGVYVPLPKFLVDGAGIVNALEWTWWLKDNGAWREAATAELQHEVRYAYMEIGLDDDSRIYSDLSTAPSGSLPFAGDIPFARVNWLRMGDSDSKGYNYGFEWR